VSHRRPEFAGHDIKDILFYAYAAGRISRAEFGTAHMVLNVKEQCDLEIRPGYQDNVLGKTKGEKFQLPAKKTRFMLADIRDPDTFEITPYGQKYLDTVASNLLASSYAPSLPQGTTQEDLSDKLAYLSGDLPSNMNMLVVIQETPPPCVPEMTPDRIKQEAEDPHLFFDRQTSAIQMPFNASPIAVQADGKIGNDRIYVPTSGMLSASLELLSASVVKPVYILGRISSRQLAKVHREGFHPVIIRDTRVQSNYLAPHGHMAGALDAAMHDECFHCVAASTYTPAQREACSHELVEAIDDAMKRADAFALQSAERVIAALTDLAVTSPINMGPESFLVAACKKSFQELDIELHKKGAPAQAFLDAQLKQVAVFKSLVTAVSISRPTLISPESLTKMLANFDGIAENCL
jgi:hypothetical protein